MHIHVHYLVYIPCTIIIRGENKILDSREKATRRLRPSLSGDVEDDCEVQECGQCARVLRRADRRIMMKLRGGTPGLSLEMETRCMERCDKRGEVCKECDSGD